MERQGEENGKKDGEFERTGYHTQAKCSDADMIKCTDCMEVQEVEFLIGASWHSLFLSPSPSGRLRVLRDWS